jgi:hypothetical protein
MEAKELRIGNWIKLDGELETTVDCHDITQLDVAPHSIIIEPIPLTEEWLLKFGKTKLGLSVQQSSYPDGDLYVGFDDKGICRLMNCSEGFNFGKEIKYVHQLQNLYFALTGEELIIKE